jgi:hypothetical protein
MSSTMSRRELQRLARTIERRLIEMPRPPRRRKVQAQDHARVQVIPS